MDKASHQKSLFERRKQSFQRFIEENMSDSIPAKNQYYCASDDHRKVQTKNLNRPIIRKEGKVCSGKQQDDLSRCEPQFKTAYFMV